MNLKFLTSRETAIGTIFLFLFALFNLVTASHSPMPWLDEISYSDPAVKWIFEGKFQSSLWGSASGGPFWVGNVPLHQFLLCVWMKIFGFSIYTIRGASIIYYVLAVGVVWRTLQRTGFLREPAYRFLFILIALSATGCVAVFRNGRYDALGCLWVALAVSALCRPSNSKKADALLFGSAALMPWTGLQLIPYFGIGTLCYLAVLKKEGIRRFLIGNFGMVFGILSLLSFYFTLGHLEQFMTAIHGQGRVWFDVQHAVFYNPTYIGLMALGMALVFGWWFRNPGRNLDLKNRVALALVGLALITPWVMHAVAKYAMYYTWMATLPCAVAVLFLTQECANRWLRLGVIGVALLSVLPGYPRRMINIASGADFQGQKEIASFINSNLHREDCALFDMSDVSLCSYYAVRGCVKSAEFYNEPDPELYNKVTCVVAGGIGRESEFHSHLGGTWRLLANMEVKENRPSKLWIALFGNPKPATLAIYQRL